MVRLEKGGFGREGCLFNIGKYLWRLMDKGRPLQDANKALWYARRLKEQSYYGTPISRDELETIHDCARVAFVKATMKVEAEVGPIIRRIEDILRDGMAPEDRDFHPEAVTDAR